MGQLFKRAWKVSVDKVQTSDLRVQFDITRTLKKEPNTCELKISNLSKQTRDQLKGAGLSVIVEGGYQGSTAVLFSGDSRTIDHLYLRNDWETHVQCGDGEQSYLYARMNESLPPGTSLKDALRKAADKMGINKGNLEKMIQGKLSFEQFTHGLAAFGPASGVFNDLIKGAGLEWSIQNGEVQVTRPGEAAQTEAFLLSPDTGLIGSPDHAPPDHKKKQAVLKCRCFLNGHIAPGRIINVQSSSVKGEFVVQKVIHKGDSEGQEWTTHIESHARSV